MLMIVNEMTNFIKTLVLENNHFVFAFFVVVFITKRSFFKKNEKFYIPIRKICQLIFIFDSHRYPKKFCLIKSDGEIHFISLKNNYLQLYFLYKSEMRIFAAKTITII